MFLDIWLSVSYTKENGPEMVSTTCDSAFLRSVVIVCHVKNDKKFKC